MISVIIVSYNTRDILHRCITSLHANSQGISMEVIVVDNNSEDGSAEMVRRSFPGIQLIANPVNTGFAAANNQAYLASCGEYVLLLNPDAFVRKDAVKHAAQFMLSTPGCGICGGRLITEEGKLDPSARRFPTWISKLFTITGMSYSFPTSPVFNRHNFGEFAHDREREVDWVPGTFTLIRRKMIDEIGFFDERFFIYYEETDLCLRAVRSGWKVFFTPRAEVIHMGGASSKTRKDETFDTAGAQVLGFRMRSEWLYHRKNGGLPNVLANAFVEFFWHLTRYLVNVFPSRSKGVMKRAEAKLMLQTILASLRDTRLGSRSPATPW